MIKKIKTFLLNILFLGVEIKPAEIKGVTGMFCTLFLLLMTAYFLKPAREMLILTEKTAEMRSYAVAMQAVLLIILVPVYGRLSRRFSNKNFMQLITIVSAVILLLFYIADILGGQISVFFFIWLGGYGAIIIAHFWAFASDLFNREAGERLFVIIAFGGTIGAWVGSVISHMLVSYLNAQELILLSAATLALSLIPSMYAVKVLPPESLAKKSKSGHEIKTSVLACFQMVISSRFLLLISLFIILFSLVNSTGEFFLSLTLEKVFEAGSNSGKITLEKSVYVGQFYSGFYSIVNLAGVLIQFFFVSRLIKRAGFSWAFTLTPFVVFLGYNFLFFVPALGLLRLIKISENSLDYSLLNTTRQMLYLPLSRQEKYEARAAIDSFGQRIGDLLQAGIVFLGLNLFNFTSREFIGLIMIFSLCSLLIAYLIQRERNRLLK